MELSEHLVLVVDELIDAHDDTVRLSEGMVRDGRWEAHIRYLHELERVGREALAAAIADERAKPRRDRFRSSFPRRGDGRCAGSGYGEGSG